MAKSNRSETRAKAGGVLAEIEQLLAAKLSYGAQRHTSPQVQHAVWGPLPQVLRVLRRDRECARLELVLDLDAAREVEIAVEAEGVHEADVLLPVEIAVPLRIAGRQFGALRLCDQQGRIFSPRDWLLAKRTATLLTRYLTGEGRYLIRRVRQRMAEPRQGPPQRAATKGLTS